MMINIIIDYLDELFPDPICELKFNKDYELLIAIVMSAQTTDKRVNMVNEVLFTKYDNLDKLANASIEDIENIIKPIGTYRKKSIFIKEIASRLISDGIEKIPNDRKYLETLPGVGRKTINVFLSVIYNEPAIAVDTHVERVSKRLGLAFNSDNVLDVENKLMKKISKDKWCKVHHQLVFFGRYKCKSRSPECIDCELKDICKYYKKINSNSK
ncbi:MAG: endonuclease III [Bacilli bacterium]|nr:endonuclease III [Bacilli bacterium]